MNAAFNGGIAGIPDDIDLSFPVPAIQDGKLSQCIGAIGMRVVRLNNPTSGRDRGMLPPRDVERILEAAAEQTPGDEPLVRPLLGLEDPDSGLSAFRTQEGHPGVLEVPRDRSSGSVTMRHAFVRK